MAPNNPIKRPGKKTSGWFSVLHIIVPLVLIILGIELAMNQMEPELYDISPQLHSGNAKILGLFHWYNPVIYLGIFLKGIVDPRLSEFIFSTAAPFFVFLSLAIAAMIILALTRNRKIKEGFYGSARWATDKDLADFGLINPYGIMLGMTDKAQIMKKIVSGKMVFDVKKEGQYIGHMGENNTLLIAPTRSGKLTGIIGPTAYSWRGSMVATDPKAELWALTAGFRRKFSKVIRFDPTKIARNLEDGSYLKDENGNLITWAKYNVLFDLRDGFDAHRDCGNLATLLVEGGGNSKAGTDSISDHFNNAAIDGLTGVLLYFMDSPAISASEKNLPGVLSFLSQAGVTDDPDSSEDGAEIIEAIKKGPYTNPTIMKAAVDAAGRMESKKDKERSGLFSTMHRALNVYSDHLVKLATEGSDFSVVDLMESEVPISLYITIPESDLKRLGPLVQAIVSFIIKRVTEKETRFGQMAVKNRILLLLDEFPLYGKQSVLVETLGLINGPGMSALVCAQSENQIITTYGANHPFFDHCKIVAVYAPGDYAFAEKMSKICGIESVDKSSVSHSGKISDAGLTGVSSQETDTQRALINADEIMRLPPDRVLISMHGMHPYIGVKNFYYRQKRWKNLSKIPAPSIEKDYRDVRTEYCSGRNNPWLNRKTEDGTYYYGGQINMGSEDMVASFSPIERPDADSSGGGGSIPEPMETLYPPYSVLDDPSYQDDLMVYYRGDSADDGLSSTVAMLTEGGNE